tara:strand:+ start:1618 stop:4179 length:2562 start_codon:yes stop_codon:yes gene_type:complete
MTNLFSGVPFDTQAFSIFDATYYIFYKDYKYYIHNYATNTTSAGVAFGNGTSVMTQIPTGQTINMGYVYHSSNWIYINVGTNWYKYTYTLIGGVPSFTYVQTVSNSSWFGGAMPTSGWDGIAPYVNGVNMYLFNGSSYNQTAYGGTGQPFDGLPHDIGCIDIRIDDTLKGWAFKGDKYYEITLTYSGIGGGTALIGRRPNGGTLVSSGTIPSAIIAIDDKYWDLVNSPVARTGTTIKPDFEIVDFTPNIIAGNYPQSGTAKGPPQGTAWYLSGTWTEWTQTSANVWASNGNTIQFTSGTVDPGVDTNGAAWIGSLGGVALTGTWSPTPFTWNVLTGNILNITNTNGSPINFSPLVDLPQPNNFTAAQAESGMFSSSNVGTMATSVLISNSVSSFKSPIFPVEIDLTFLSVSQVIMRRSWEIIDTTYTLNSSNVLSGQYVSPTYPVSSSLASKTPDSYTMPTPWVVLAELWPSPIQLLFSGGFINTITASGGYHINVNAPPVGITYAWTANYYDVDNILISAVVGAGTTGTQSNFTIDLLTIPAAAEYIFYTCTSSEGADAVISIIIIQGASATPFVLDFQYQSAQIVVDATYSVTPKPVDANTTYAYTATYNNEFDASLGNVLGAVASGSSSSFNFVYANMPLGTKYIDYTCNATGGNQGGETARLSISIIPQIPPSPQSFELQFNGGAYPVNITSNGNYSVVPFPTESALIITYTYTADYYSGVKKLGSVVGFDPTGLSSSFPFTFAGMPLGAEYIKYICSASGIGLQNGQSAEHIIGLVSPSGSGSGDVDLIRSTSGSIIFNQYNSEDSLKLLTGDRLAGLTMTLTDSYGDTLYSPAPCYYELNVRSSNSG